MSGAVVKLPTAAPRKVNNHRWKEQRLAGRALKDVYADWFDYALPFERAKMAEVEKMADYMLSNRLEGERAVVYAILHALDEDTKLKALATAVGRGRDAAALAHLACATPEQRYWLRRLIERKTTLKGGEA